MQGLRGAEILVISPILRRLPVARIDHPILGALEFVDSLSLSAHTDADGGEATLVLTLREAAETE